MSFSSSKDSGEKKSAAKRKAEQLGADSTSPGAPVAKKAKVKTKKKDDKKLLSFVDDG